MVGGCGFEGHRRRSFDGTFGTPGRKMVSGGDRGRLRTHHQPRTQTGRIPRQRPATWRRNWFQSPASRRDGRAAGGRRGRATPAVAVTAAAGADAASRVARRWPARRSRRCGARSRPSRAPRPTRRRRVRHDGERGCGGHGRGNPTTRGRGRSTGADPAHEGQATRDPAQLKFEVETAKLPDMPRADPRPPRAAERPDPAQLRRVDRQTKAEAPNPRAVGQSVDSALVKQAASGQGADPFRLQGRGSGWRAGATGDASTTGSAPERLPRRMPTAPLRRREARRRACSSASRARRLRAADPSRPRSKRAETFRWAISRATDQSDEHPTGHDHEGPDRRVDRRLGGNLYKQARAMRARYAQNYEDRASTPSCSRRAADGRPPRRIRGRVRSHHPEGQSRRRAQRAPRASTQRRRRLTRPGAICRDRRRSGSRNRPSLQLRDGQPRQSRRRPARLGQRRSRRSR